MADWLLSAGGMAGKTAEAEAGVSLGPAWVTTHSSAVMKQRIASKDRHWKSFFVANLRLPTHLNISPRETLKGRILGPDPL
jgi:hypothetical protein